MQLLTSVPSHITKPVLKGNPTQYHIVSYLLKFDQNEKIRELGRDSESSPSWLRLRLRWGWVAVAAFEFLGAAPWVGASGRCRSCSRRPEINLASLMEVKARRQRRRGGRECRWYCSRGEFELVELLKAHESKLVASSSRWWRSCGKSAADDGRPVKTVASLGEGVADFDLRQGDAGSCRWPVRNRCAVVVDARDLNKTGGDPQDRRREFSAMSTAAR